MEKIKSVVIKLPILSNSLASGKDSTRAMRFLRELHSKLKPLTRYRLLDGRAAVYATLRNSIDSSTLLDQAFHFRHGLPKVDDTNRGWWVIMLALEDPTQSMHREFINLYAKDFAGSAPLVVRAFSRVVEHLEKHATTPEALLPFVSRALEILKAK